MGVTQGNSTLLNLVGKKASKAEGPEITVSDIQSFAGDIPSLTQSLDDRYDYQATMNPEQKRILAEKKRYEGALPELSPSDMFPSAGNNINKGSYSGSVVGNVPIFAPSELTPFAVFDAKKRALAAAAEKKAAEIDAFYKLAAPPETKRFAVQTELDDQFTRGLDMWVNNAKQNYGDDWDDALKNDTGFNGWLESMRTVAKYEDGIVNNVSRLQELDANGDLTLSPQSRKAIQDYMDGIGGLSDPFNPQGHKLGSTILRANAETNLDVAVNDAVKEYKDKAFGGAPSPDDKGTYDMYVTWETTGMTDKQVKEIAAGIWKDQYGGQSDLYTQEDIEKRIRAIYPLRSTSKMETVGTAGGDGADEVYTEDDIAKEPANFNVTVANADPNNPDRVAATSGYAGVTFKKPIKTKIAKGETVMDLNTGSPVVGSGAEDITWGQTVVVPTVGGVVVSNDMIPKLQQGGQKVEYKVMAIGTYTVPEKKSPGGVVVSPEKKVTVTKPAKELENAFVKTWNDDGTVKRGVPIDRQQKEADRLNSQGGNKSGAKMIRVRRKSDGQAGSIPADNFNPEVYEKI